MLKEELGSLAAFVEVAEARSFTRAAGKLGTSQSALSHKIRRLETRLGVRLLSRTTRSVSPTDAGAQLLESLRPSLDDIARQLAVLAGERDIPSGTLRITSADHAAETILWPAVQRLLLQHPQIAVELDIDNGLVDIVAERYDAGVRMGHNVAKDMIAVPIGPPERVVVVGSPAYFERHPQPQEPSDLASHRCINRRLPTLGGPAPWPFEKDGQQAQVRVSGPLAFNRSEMVLAAAVNGFGLACLLQTQAAAEIQAGRLLPVLQDWCAPLPAYHLYYPSRRQNTPAFELLVEQLRYRGPP